MSDKELLELAAKATWYVYRESPEWHNTGAPQIWDGKDWIDWNPLIDDGDALRLAVKLKIELLHSHANESPLWVSAVVKNTTAHGAQNYLNEDQCIAATRHAIVRAAAAIGKYERGE